MMDFAFQYALKMKFHDCGTHKMMKGKKHLRDKIKDVIKFLGQMGLFRLFYYFHREKAEKKNIKGKL